MRREWTALVKNRQWDELAKIAREEPSQLLCDTVAEWEKGFAEKPDRRGLRRALFLLKQAGYLPTEADEDIAGSAVEVVPFRLGYMGSADGSGRTTMAYAEERKGKVRWLTTYVHETQGIVQADELEFTRDEAEAALERTRSKQIPYCVHGEVSPDWVLSRLKRSIEMHPKQLPTVIAFWRSVIDKGEDMPHPAESLEAGNVSDDELTSTVVKLRPALPWRLELGSVAPLLQELIDSYDKEGEASAEDRSARSQALIEQVTPLLCTEEVLRDQMMRLLDLAYLLNTANDPDWTLALASARDLQKRGAASPYAKMLVNKTVAILVESFRNSGESAGKSSG